MDFLHRAHNVVLVRIHASGDEEWYCPECHECFFLRMPCQAFLEAGPRMRNQTRGKVKKQHYRNLGETVETNKLFISGSSEDPYLKPWLDYLEKR
jgi:hypothetical protein